MALPHLGIFNVGVCCVSRCVSVVSLVVAFGKVVLASQQKGGVRSTAALGRWGARDRGCSTCTIRKALPAPSTVCSLGLI